MKVCSRKRVAFRGHKGDVGEAYYARPLGAGPFPGVVLIHHMPGWDWWIKEATRKLAYHGLATISPHLYFRDGPGSPDDVGARVRAAGGVADEQVVGDVAGCMEFLRAQPYANGKVGVIGFCSGGRHTYLAACTLAGIDAAVDCWGGNVIVDDPKQLNAKRPVAPIDLTEKLTCPLLGLFGNDDENPNRDQVNRTEAVLKKLGKNYEFHRYDGAGHAFFNAARPAYPARAGARRLGQGLRVLPQASRRAGRRARGLKTDSRRNVMCSYIVEKAKLLGSAKGPNGWMRIDTANVYYDHPFHAPLDHALGIDFINEAEGGRERVAVELSAELPRANWSRRSSPRWRAARSSTARRLHHAHAPLRRNKQEAGCGSRGGSAMGVATQNEARRRPLDPTYRRRDSRARPARQARRRDHPGDLPGLARPPGDRVSAARSCRRKTSSARPAISAILGELSRPPKYCPQGLLRNCCPASC